MMAKISMVRKARWCPRVGLTAVLAILMAVLI